MTTKVLIEVASRENRGIVVQTVAEDGSKMSEMEVFPGEKFEFYVHQFQNLKVIERGESK